MHNLNTTQADKTVKQKISETVSLIPAGRVVYYGQVAQLVGVSARVVGWILSGMTEEECSQIPWHRVVAKTGDISALKLGYKGNLQVQLLQQEGVDLSSGRIDMLKYGYNL